MEVRDIVRCYLETCNHEHLTYDEIEAMFASKTSNLELQKFLQTTCPSCYNDHDRRNKSENIRQVFSYMSDRRNSLRKVMRKLTSFDFSATQKCMAFILLVFLLALPETINDALQERDRHIQRQAWQAREVQAREAIRTWEEKNKNERQEEKERLVRTDKKRHDRYKNWERQRDNSGIMYEIYGDQKLDNNDYTQTIVSVPTTSNSTIQVLNDQYNLVQRVTTQWFGIIDQDIAHMTNAFGLSIEHKAMKNGRLGEADMMNRHIRLNLDVIANLYRDTDGQLVVLHELHHIMSSCATTLLEKYNSQLLSLLEAYLVEIDQTECFYFFDMFTTASDVLNDFRFYNIQELLADRRFYLWVKRRLAAGNTTPEPLYVLLASHLNTRIRSLYNRLPFFDNPYQNVYQGTNYQEYFAVAAEQYLGTNTSWRLDMNGNPIDRAWVKEHDPGMFQLLQDIYGGRDVKI